MKPLFTLIGIALLVPGCLAKQPAYSVRRAALVPHAGPTTSSGQPLDRATELSFGAGALAAPVEPSQGDPNAGLHVPNHQVNAGFRIKPTANFDVGVVYERGFNAGSTSLAADQPEVPHGDAVGYGVSTRYSGTTSNEHLRIGMSLDLLTYSVPYVEYRTCVANCTQFDETEIDEGTAIVPAFSFAIIPSYRAGRFTVFGGITVGNHPTVEKSGMESGFGDGSNVEVGPLSYVASVGADVALSENLRASVVVYQPVGSGPVDYGPTLAASIKIPLGPEPPATRRD